MLETVCWENVRFGKEDRRIFGYIFYYDHGRPYDLQYLKQTFFYIMCELSNIAQCWRILLKNIAISVHDEVVRGLCR